MLGFLITTFTLLSTLFWMYDHLVCGFLFSKLGWKIDETINISEINKTYPKVIFVILHTSWVDGIIAVLSCNILRVYMYNIVKYKWMKCLTIIAPYYRPIALQSVSTKSIIDFMNKQETCCMSLAPEGSRQFVSPWRTGWHVIAQQTNAVIIPIGLDYSTKTVHLHTVFKTTEDYNKDLIIMQNELSKYIPKYPNKCSLFNKPPSN